MLNNTPIKFSLLGQLASQYLNCPYMWGGNGPFEFDCSGFVLSVLRDIGINYPDMRACDLYDRLKNRSLRSQLGTDSILFFGDTIYNIKHVAIALDDRYMIEAGGAGSNCKTIEDARKLNARVRIKLIESRSDLVASIKLEY